MIGDAPSAFGDRPRIHANPGAAVLLTAQLLNPQWSRA